MLSITIITVCYNSATTITDTLNSVRTQSYPHIEHIVIDGGSSDDTVHLARKHGQSGIVVLSEPDKGIYDAMNKGLRLARGDVIGFLNADDYYANDSVLAEVARLFILENVDAVFGDTEFFHPNQPEKSIRRYRSSHFNPERIAWGWMPAHPSLFLRRSLFAEKGEFKTNYRIAGDFELVARFFSNNTLTALTYRYLPQVMVRMRTGGISTGGWRNTVLLNQEVMRACQENGIATNWFKILSKYPLKLLEFFQKAG